MSENELPEVPATALGPIRPLSVRITDGLRAQLEVIAQLNDRSVTEEIRLALEAWVETSKSDPKVLQRAETVRAEIEREARPSRVRSRPSSEAHRPAADAPPSRLPPDQRRASGIEHRHALPGVSAPTHPPSLLPRGLSENQPSSRPRQQ